MTKASKYTALIPHDPSLRLIQNNIQMCGLCIQQIFLPRIIPFVLQATGGITLGASICACMCCSRAVGIRKGKFPIRHFPSLYHTEYMVSIKERQRSLFKSHSLCLEVRGQPRGIGSSFYHVGSRNLTQVIRPGNKHPQPLSYLAVPSTDFYIEKKRPGAGEMALPLKAWAAFAKDLCRSGSQDLCQVTHSCL